MSSLVSLPHFSRTLPFSCVHCPLRMSSFTSSSNPGWLLVYGVARYTRVPHVMPEVADIAIGPAPVSSAVDGGQKARQAGAAQSAEPQSKESALSGREGKSIGGPKLTAESGHQPA